MERTAVTAPEEEFFVLSDLSPGSSFSVDQIMETLNRPQGG